MATDRICTIPDCGKRTHSRGYCNEHYRRVIDQKRPPERVRAPFGARRAFVLKVAASPPVQDCIFWNPKKPQTYVVFKHEGEYFTGHRLACEIAHGPPPAAKMDAAHGCGNRGCVNPQHLRWATRLDNMADSLAHGTRRMGERCARAKISESVARHIKHTDPRKSSEIAAELGVHLVTVRDIRNGRTWKHI